MLEVVFSTVFGSFETPEVFADLVVVFELVISMDVVADEEDVTSVNKMYSLT